MRYVVAYKPGTVRVIAYVHVDATGKARIPVGASTYEIKPPAPHHLALPELSNPYGPGPEGITYHG